MEQNRTYKKFLLVRQEGNRHVQRNIDYYNLDMLIAIGYRVQSPSRKSINPYALIVGTKQYKR